MRIKDSLNVTFDESLPESNSSPLVEDNRINEPIVQDLNVSSSLQVNVSDEVYPKSVKEARGHLMEKVIEKLNERTLRGLKVNVERPKCPLNVSSSLQVNVSDKVYPKSVKEARSNPIEQVIGELNERTLRSKTQQA
ncbi:hypothetical protein Tco_0098449 [Tanacetum coccineum]